MKDKWGTGESYVYMGEVLSKQAKLLNAQDAKLNYHEAIQYINKGVLLLKEVGYKETEKFAYEVLADIYAELNDYKMALEYKKLHMTLKDSLMNNETTLKLEQQRIQYEVEIAVTEEKIQQGKALAELKFKNEISTFERISANPRPPWRCEKTSCLRSCAGAGLPGDSHPAHSAILDTTGSAGSQSALASVEQSIGFRSLGTCIVQAAKMGSHLRTVSPVGAWIRSTRSSHSSGRVRRGST